jgi:hypothetical protein
MDSICFLAAACLAVGSTASQEPELVFELGRRTKISDTSGGFAGGLANYDQFGSAVAPLGDLDGDGVPDLAVGAWRDGADDRGAIWILHLNADGSVRRERRIGSGTSGFSGALDADDRFGNALAYLDDLNGDGVADLAVGARRDDDGGINRGAVWILFLNMDGSVAAQQKISDLQGLFTGVLDDHDHLGSALASPGDLDGDGLPDLIVGAAQDDDGGLNRGAIWVLFLNADGTVRAHQKISQTAGGFPDTLGDTDLFGSSVAITDDLNGDSIRDVVVGARNDDEIRIDAGAIWILYMRTDGTVSGAVKIPSVFASTSYGTTHYFGSAVTSVGDLDGDGLPELVVGAPGRTVEMGTSESGDAALLFLGPNAGVERVLPLTYGCGFEGWDLSSGDQMGYALTALGDLDGDGLAEWVLGLPGEDDGGLGRGAVWVMSLERRTIFPFQDDLKISQVEGGFTGALDDLDYFGMSLRIIGDLDADGIEDLAAGAPGDDDGGPSRGAVWILYRNADGSVRAQQKISALEGGFAGPLDDGSSFGYSLAFVGDVDGDGTNDVAVGAPQDADSDDMYDIYGLGAVWILFLNPDGTVKAHQKISDLEGGLAGALYGGNFFGSSLTALGDVDGNGVIDLAVGAFGDSDFDYGGGPQNCIYDPFSYRGAVWLLLLNPDGTVLDHRKISDRQGGFTGQLQDGDYFGWSVASLGDLDGDGTFDLAVGAPLGECQSYPGPSVWILHLNPDGTVKSNLRITDGLAGFHGGPDYYSFFGASLANLGDLDGDGTLELAVGAPYDGVDSCSELGAIWVLSLLPDGSVARYSKLGVNRGFPKNLDDEDLLGWSMTGMSSTGGEFQRLLIGAPGDDDGGSGRGAIWAFPVEQPSGRRRDAGGTPVLPGGAVSFR